jgi:hypothetical protein
MLVDRTVFVVLLPYFRALPCPGSGRDHQRDFPMASTRNGLDVKKRIAGDVPRANLRPRPRKFQSKNEAEYE